MPEEKARTTAASSRRNAISRREFALRAALASAAATISPGAAFSAGDLEPTVQESPGAPKLTPEGQAEVEARVQAILLRYGSRLSADQKSDIRRLATLLQPPLDSLRAYALHNGDSPALYLKPLVEREKRPIAAPAAAAKKS